MFNDDTVGSLHDEPWGRKTLGHPSPAAFTRRRRWAWPVLALLGMVPTTQAVADEDGILPNWLELGASVEVGYEAQRNFDLDSGQSDKIDLLPVELQFEAEIAFAENFRLVFQPTLRRDIELREEGRGETRVTELLIEELFVALSDPPSGLSLLVGRQPYEDARQWFYDEELDAVRGQLENEALTLELSIARELLVDDDLLSGVANEPVNIFILYGAYRPIPTITLGAYQVLQDDRRSSDDRTVHLGLFSHGVVAERLRYWFDAAYLDGQEDGTQLRGFGLDLLASYDLGLPLSPHVTLGYAFGSGDDDPDDDFERAFRQTGFQSNEVAVGGLTPLSFYGEAFDPELSNLHIFTAGAGIRPLEELSIDLLYHHYRQVEASNELGDSAFSAQPNGRKRRLGDALDLVIGYQPEEEFYIRGFFGYFEPGRAFGQGADPAFFGRLEVLYEF